MIKKPSQQLCCCAEDCINVSAVATGTVAIVPDTCKVLVLVGTTSSSNRTITSNIATIIDINFNWVGVKQIRPNGREKQTNEGPWPENMANLVHGFLEIFLRKA